MDFDLKIGAVFSLADDRKEAYEGCDKTDLNADNGHLLSDGDDNVCMDIDYTPTISSSLTPTETFGETACYLEKASNESLSFVDDQDTPPSLILQDHDSQDRLPSFMPSLECMSPPVLLPEEPVQRAISPEKKKKCTKIAPCYIVLTSIDPTMQAKVYISSRAFKRSFVECSNMCKKVMFRRRLKAGKDVFNVKTPSKQKDYLLYLMKEQEKSKRNKKNTVQCTKIQDIIEKHDLKVAARKNSFGTHAHPRVRRTVSKLPKDFAARPLSPLQEELTQNMENVSTEELERIQSEFIKKTHKLELNSLKRLIGIKRSLNQNLKKNKRLKPDGFENFLKSDVTSSVSGRVRKVNRRYGPDFAVSRKDFEEQRFFEVAQSQLKRAETENKRKKEEIFDYMLQKRRKKSIDTTETEKMSTNRKIKTPIITIENLEKDDAGKAQFKSKKSNIQTRKTNAKANAIKDLLESPLVPGFKENELTVDDKNVKNSKQKRHCRNINKNTVLIQDLPKEENVISSFLQETENPMEQKPFVIDTNKTSEIKDGDQYGRAKQLLKDSLSRKSLRQQKISQNITQSQEIKSSNSHSSHATEQEKVKVLRIPETVQKLFKPTDIKIKQEPPDDGYETKTNPPISNNPKIVTIAYSNGLYKKVLMTVPTTASAAPPPCNIRLTKPSNTVTAPIIMNTKEGLRYLVPNQFLSKLPSYSDAIKAKFTQKTSDTRNIAPMVSSFTAANINNIFNVSGITQQSTISSGFRPHLQQEKYVNNIPTVVQVSLNNVTNSSTSSASPAVIVCQPSFNKAFQQTVISIKSPICTIPKETQTVVHKVSPAVQKNFEENNPKSIQQHSVPMMSTHAFSGTPYIKKVGEKSKFYLLKIDGKNVLIPTEGDQAHPKAYVVNNDFINSNTLPKTQGSLVASSAALGNIQPTLSRCPASSTASQKQSTLTMVPNVKPGNSTFHTPLALVPNVTSLSQNKSLLQTVTLTNVDTVSPGELVNKAMLNRYNTVGNTAMIVGTNTIVGNTASLSVNVTVKNETNTVISSMNSVSAMKTTAAFTDVVKSGSLMVTPNSVTSQPSLTQNNANNMQQDSLSLVPLFLKPSDSSPFCGILQSNVVQARSKNVISPVKSPLDTQREAKTRPSLLITNMPNALMQKQVSPLRNSSLVQQGQTTVRSQLDSLRKNKTKTSQGITYKADGQSDVTLVQKDIPPSMVNTPGQTTNNISAHGGTYGNNKNDHKLCEKTGKFEVKERCEENATEQAIETEPRPFKEAVTAREERLRRLKELLKEKQKAVDEIRSNIPK